MAGPGIHEASAVESRFVLMKAVVTVVVHSRSEMVPAAVEGQEVAVLGSWDCSCGLVGLARGVARLSQERREEEVLEGRMGDMVQAVACEVKVLREQGAARACTCLHVAAVQHEDCEVDQDQAAEGLCLEVVRHIHVTGVAALWVGHASRERATPGWEAAFAAQNLPEPDQTEAEWKGPSVVGVGRSVRQARTFEDGRRAGVGPGAHQVEDPYARYVREQVGI